MDIFTLKLTGMAHGGTAVGRDKKGRPVFVPFGIPGEKVRVNVQQGKNRYARADLVEVLKPSPDRTPPRCPHFGVCGGCHFQQMNYAAQLRAKHSVVVDQLQRIGGLKNVSVLPTLPNLTPWHYRLDMSFSPTPEGGIGLWSPQLQRIMLLETCEIMHPDLLALWRDIDLALPGLRKLTLRVGAGGDMLAALEVDQVEPPLLEVDFPVSVAIVLPDKTAASLIGDPYLLQTVKERDFRVSPGCFFQPSVTGAELVVDVLLAYANLEGTETVLELYSGVGLLTAFLAEKAQAVVCVEVNGDAVADTAVNLDHTDNVTLYQGWAEEILPALEITPDLVVVNPPSEGLSAAVMDRLRALKPARLIYISSEIATLARDGKQLTGAGYKLVEVQPIDVVPQTFQVDTVSLWSR